MVSYAVHFTVIIFYPFLVYDHIYLTYLRQQSSSLLRKKDKQLFITQYVPCMFWSFLCVPWCFKWYRKMFDSEYFGFPICIISPMFDTNILFTYHQCYIILANTASVNEISLIRSHTARFMHNNHYKYTAFAWNRLMYYNGTLTMKKIPMLSV